MPVWQTVRCEAAGGVGDEVGGNDRAGVRWAFHVHGWSVKENARELHVSRNTLRKILRTDETDLSYERERAPMPQIGPWQERLDQVLSASAPTSRPSNG